MPERGLRPRRLGPHELPDLGTGSAEAAGRQELSRQELSHQELTVIQKKLPSSQQCYRPREFRGAFSLSACTAGGLVLAAEATMVAPSVLPSRSAEVFCT
jgi:hypothetical protein